MTRPASPIELNLVRLGADGFLVVPDYVGAEGLARARELARGLPAWDEDAREASIEALRAERLEIGAASVEGVPLSRRCWAMGLGPRRPEDPAHALWGRRARAPAPASEADELFQPVVRARPGARVHRFEAEAAYPGHEGWPEGRARAEQWASGASGAEALRALVVLDDVGPADGALLVYPGSHRGASPAPASGTGVMRELLTSFGEPLVLDARAGSLILLHPALLRAEAPRRSRTPARRLSAILGPVEPVSAAPAPIPVAPRPRPLRRLIQWAKLSVLFPLSRRLRAPLTMVNVGAGRAWQHPSVLALDVDPETNLNHDVAAAGLPFADTSMDAVYSSHCLEHLSPPDAKAFFAEARRCLRPGGVLRIVCPDMDLLFDAYERGDAAWFDWCSGGFYVWDGWLRAIGRVAATLAVDRFSDEELRRAYDEGGRAGFLRMLSSAQDELDAPELSRWPDAHKSWWTRPKLLSALREAGFADAYESGRGGSRVPVFRDARYFDCSSPSMSLYVEAAR